jgi:hypothetical protein
MYYKRIKDDVKRLAGAHSSLILAKHYPHFMRALARKEGSEFMDDYAVINFIINLLLFCALVWLVVKRDKNSFIVLDDKVLIRGTVFSRLFNFGVKTVKQSDVVKVQVAGKIVSVFNQSDNAYDIFTFIESSNDVLSQAKVIFPNAEVVVISS